MTNAAEILARIDEKAPFAMVIEASVRDYCVLALQFLKGQAQPQQYFETSLLNPLPVLDQEASAQKHAQERYCQQLYKPSEEALLADAIADLAFAQSQRLVLAMPASPQADDRERACSYTTAQISPCCSWKPGTTLTSLPAPVPSANTTIPAGTAATNHSSIRWGKRRNT